MKGGLIDVQIAPLPPDVEKMWITVDRALFMWVSTVLERGDQLSR
jgi:hypothetical protein